MFQERIRQHYDHLSRSYRRVADYLLSDYQSAAFMTAAALAQAVDVDTTTVVRFAQRLGYPGYPELIDDVQRKVKAELAQTYVAPSTDDSPQARVQHQIAQERANLDKALAHNTLDAIETTLDMLRAAPRIIVIGESYAAPLAESFAGMLKDAGLPAIYVGGDLYERADALARLGRKEIVIGVSPLMGPSGVARTLEFARSEGATTLACAPTLNSQVARASEYLLYAAGESDAPMPGLTGLYAFLTAIALTLSAADPQQAARRRQQADRALEALS